MHTGKVNDSKKMSNMSYIKMQVTFTWVINVFRNGDFSLLVVELTQVGQLHTI